MQNSSYICTIINNKKVMNKLEVIKSVVSLFYTKPFKVSEGFGGIVLEFGWNQKPFTLSDIREMFPNELIELGKVDDEDRGVLTYFEFKNTKLTRESITAKIKAAFDNAPKGSHERQKLIDLAFKLELMGLWSELKFINDFV